MRIKEEYLLQNIVDKWVVISTNPQSDNYNTLFTLNNTARYLWTQVEKGLEESELVEAMMEHFGIDRALAESDVNKFISRLNEAGCLENESREDGQQNCE